MFKGILAAIMIVGVGGSAAYTVQAKKQVEEVQSLADRQADRLAALQEQVGTLESRLQELASAQRERSRYDSLGISGATEVAAPETADAAGREMGNEALAFAADEARIERLSDLVEGATEGRRSSPRVKSELRALLAEIEEEDEQERREQREERRLERIENRVKRYTERLHLQQSQEQDLVEIFAEQQASRDQLRRQMRSGDVPRGEIRGMFEQAREDTNLAVQEVLTSDQYEEYLKIQEEERADGPGGFFGGRGRRGGGGNTAPAPNTGTGGNTSGGRNPR